MRSAKQAGGKRLGACYWRGLAREFQAQGGGTAGELEVKDKTEEVAEGLSDGLAKATHSNPA
eukprot:3385085-Lingulodinium_polyedra.AAC.1